MTTCEQQSKAYRVMVDNRYARIVRREKSGAFVQFEDTGAIVFRGWCFLVEVSATAGMFGP